jgi:hypothetical protein
MSNHYWKHTDGRVAITASENTNIGDEWVEISYDEYITTIRPTSILTDGK